jgi:hypothetical protein
MGTMTRSGGKAVVTLPTDTQIKVTREFAAPKHLVYRGFEVGFHGVFREVVANERLVYTEVYEGVPGGDDDPPVVTLTLTESGRRTTLTSLSQLSSREVRDMIIKSGMEAGLQDVLDVLEEVAVSLI